METSSFSDQLRLADKYFLAQLLLCFREPTSSGLVIIQNMYFPEVGVASKQPLFQRNNFFRSRYFLRAVTFSEMLVLRNQVCCIYTWIDYPLTIIYSFKYTKGWSDFKYSKGWSEITQFIIIEKNVWISILDVLQMWLFMKLVVIAVSSNKISKIGPLNLTVFEDQKTLQWKFVKNS